MLIHLFALLIGKSSIIAIFHSKGQFSNENRPYAFMVKVHETHSPYPERMLIDGIVPSPCIKSFFRVQKGCIYGLSFTVTPKD